MALGMVLRGFSVSAAVIPMNSIEVKANMTICKALTQFMTPLGKKLKLLVMFDKLTEPS